MYFLRSSKTRSRTYLIIVNQELSTRPHDSIAILVRSRSQLRFLLKEFRRQHFYFQGIEIEKLSHLPHVRDLWSLVLITLRPSHRLAWLTFLRSPWCGLSLSDLNSIANYAPNKSIYYALSDLDNLKDLSAEGRIRVQHVFQILRNAISHRFENSLTISLVQIMKDLNSEILLSKEEHRDLDPFWELLSSHEQNGTISDLKQFINDFKNLYSKSSKRASLQVMTIHKSKGLEFDTVILPGLSTKTIKGASPLIRWLKIPTSEHNELFLLSPIQASVDDTSPLYNYLGLLEEEKNKYELKRLLYVALTRAKKRLYLTDFSEKGVKGSLREILNVPSFVSVKDNEPIEAEEEINPTLFRLPLSFFTTSFSSPKQNEAQILQLTETDSRQIGIITHRLLQWICTLHPNYEEIPWTLVEYDLKKYRIITAKHPYSYDPYSNTDT